MDDYSSTTPVPLPAGKADKNSEEQEDGFFHMEEPAEEFEELTAVLHAAEEGEQEEQALEDASAPNWDGSEAEFVPDEDAAEYEEHYTGIKLTYTLHRDEILACLKKGGYYNTTGKKVKIETALMALLGIMFTVSYFRYGGANNLWLAAVCLLVIAAVWVVPYFDMQGHSKQHANAQTFVCIYPDEVVVGKSGSEWSIPLDGTSQFAEFENLMVLFAPQQKMVAIPLRAIEPAVLADVQAMLLAGTVPKEE